ncbi:hypothetical protein DSM106972_020560 [Dulcicalothrix desertica PCC 7102]|uniref:RNA ligase 2 C-terminal domain-containing protein n=1 Tax=Dulcicalothrix desertica PCC 7102 TaxID=232991 RepID=A0A3S1ARS2_9CYAN|nr:RNA ligase family protein [Dulcicalothrix desertica]RUT07796.1 hypothetical protein DSM106972_020560 [Dulcicalothrix desertica PCC 7102]TWH39320.1 hypothetical protein CAL7102_08545 [Dulcicalothrix desertica PCC 7102]
MDSASWKYSSYEKISEGLNQLQLNESDYRLLKKVDWVVTEKIHGANFGIIVTLNRLKNVISKVGRFSGNDNQKERQLKLIVELLIWDILDSFNETGAEKSFNNLSSESQQLIINKLEEAGLKLVEEYYDLFNSTS